MKKSKSSNKRGFTLTELIIVLVIMALMAVIAVPNVIGFANKYKETNCVNGVDRILTTIQNQTAAGRYTDELSVSKAIVNAISDVYDLGDVVYKNEMGVTLHNYCNNKNNVKVTWKVTPNNYSGDSKGASYDADETTYFYVTVSVKCLKDGTSGTNEFYCGKKTGTDVSDIAALKEFLLEDVMGDSAVKSAYESKSADSLRSAIASAFGIKSSTLKDAKTYYESKIASLTMDETEKINAALSLYLTVAINENPSFSEMFTENYYGADYMPVILFEGTANVYDEDTNRLEFSANGFSMYGVRGGTWTDPTKDEYWFTNTYISYVKDDSGTSKMVYIINSFWTYELDNVYFIKEVINKDTLSTDAFYKSSVITPDMKSGSYSNDTWKSKYEPEQASTEANGTSATKTRKAVNINTASAEEIASALLIDQSVAEGIVELREIYDGIPNVTVLYHEYFGVMTHEEYLELKDYILL